MRTLAVLFLLCFVAAASAQEPANGSHGSPVGWTSSGRTEKFPNGGRPQTKTEFPQIHDWNSLNISLQRTMCFGSCPAYSVEIHGDGSVVYDGQTFVAVSGVHKTKISEDAVRQLFAAFQKADFFWLLDRYAASITDFPSYAVTISFDGSSKKVVDYAGRAVGMPADVVDIEQQIDLIAGTRKWVSGDADTLPALVAEGWDFHSDDNANLALVESAAQSGNQDFLFGLLSKGVSAKSLFGCNALMEAARKDDSVLAQALIRAGAPAHWEGTASTGRQASCDALHAAAEWGDPAMVAAVLNQHPNVNWQDSEGITALMAAARNELSDKPGQDYGATADLLVKAGADVNARDARGRSALMMANFSGAAVRALLHAGAKDVDTPDDQGQTPLMNSDNPDVTLALLQAGANPYFKDQNGETALQKAEQNDWRKTAQILKEWMAAHPQ